MTIIFLCSNLNKILLILNIKYGWMGRRWEGIFLHVGCFAKLSALFFVGRRVELFLLRSVVFMFIIINIRVGDLGGASAGSYLIQ